MQDRNQMESDAAMWSGIFVAIGVGTFLSSFVQSGSFGLMGAKLARRVRELTFGALLRQASPLIAAPDAGDAALHPANRTVAILRPDTLHRQ
jgi:ABC transporter transmembrane region